MQTLTPERMFQTQDGATVAVVPGFQLEDSLLKVGDFSLIKKDQYQIVGLDFDANAPETIRPDQSFNLIVAKQ